VPAVAALAALLLASILAGCTLGGRDDRSALATTRASDFRLADIRQTVVLIRVVVGSTSRLSERDRKELPALYESTLLEALDARAVLVRDVRSVDSRAAGGELAAAAARAREVGVDHALIVNLRVDTDVGVCARRHVGRCRARPRCGDRRRVWCAPPMAASACARRSRRRTWRRTATARDPACNGEGCRR
jgi:hypothetical protein